MSNLLPEKEKDLIKRHHLSRLFALALFYVFMSVVFGVILLLPPIILSNSKSESSEKRLEILEESVAYKTSTNIEKSLLETNNDLKSARGFVGKRPIEDYLEPAISSKGGGVELSSLSYRDIDEKSGEISLSGIAINRDSILSYIEKLKTISSFSDINLPIGSLANDRDIEFSLRFVVNLVEK